MVSPSASEDAITHASEQILGLAGILTMFPCASDNYARNLKNSFVQPGIEPGPHDHFQQVYHCSLSSSGLNTKYFTLS